MGTNAINDTDSKAMTIKWMWMMDYCKKHGTSPTIGWGIAEKAWFCKEAKKDKLN